MYKLAYNSIRACGGATTIFCAALALLVLPPVLSTLPLPGGERHFKEPPPAETYSAAAAGSAVAAGSAAAGSIQSFQSLPSIQPGISRAGWVESSGIDSGWARAVGAEFGALEGLLRQIQGLLTPILDALGFSIGVAQAREAQQFIARPAAAIALYENEQVRKFMRIYLNARGGSFGKGLSRAGTYLPMMERIFKEEGLPPDLVHLSIVESNLNPRALSSKQAAGLWQFMRPTARQFGLRVDPWYDERLDPVLSTRAAARLLRYLHEKMGNWELALAAYNAGEGRVSRAIRASEKSGAPQDYWNLSLPRQTRHYVPAFMAVALIYNDLEHFGFDPWQPKAYLEYEMVWDGFRTSLQAIAEHMDYPLDQLQELNPAWKQGYIPPSHKGDVLLRLPPGGREQLRQAGPIAQLAGQPAPSRPMAQSGMTQHRVRHGETLSGIAQQYGVSMAVLLSVNEISNRHLLRRGRTVLIPLQQRPPVPEAKQQI